jgi:hypothetical protein
MTREDTTALQTQLLNKLRSDRAVWSCEELAIAVADDLGEPSSEAPAATVSEALETLVEGGLVHSLGEGLLCVSRRGLAADPGGAALEVPSEGGSGRVGVFDQAPAERELAGGAEGLSAGLVPLAPRGE